MTMMPGLLGDAGDDEGVVDSANCDDGPCRSGVLVAVVEVQLSPLPSAPPSCPASALSSPAGKEASPPGVRMSCVCVSGDSGEEDAEAEEGRRGRERKHSTESERAASPSFPPLYPSSSSNGTPPPATRLTGNPLHSPLPEKVQRGVRAPRHAEEQVVRLCVLRVHLRTHTREHTASYLLAGLETCTRTHMLQVHMTLCVRTPNNISTGGVVVG